MKRYRRCGSLLYVIAIKKRKMLLKDLRSLARKYKQELNEGKTWEDLEDLESEIKSIVKSYIASDPSYGDFLLGEAENVLIDEGLDLEMLAYYVY